MTEIADIPRFASGVTAVYGLSGSGKSALVDTAAEYVAERFGHGTMCVAIDPGGWGNRRLSLVRAGVMKVYDPRNHVNFFDTMDKLTRGAWPETILDPDRGYADPTVRLVLPRQPVFVRKCPQGHEVARFDREAVMLATTSTCPTCGVVVTGANQQTERLVVRPALFQRIGLRAFDSITAMNDQGLILELPDMSARGELPTTGGGGSALGSADAIRQGDTVYGTGSKAQVGFMQNRTYGWLTNIRAIPDQLLGAICTFGVEQSGGDDARGGGEICYGLALAGTARTARAPGWVGNCLHATKEPDDMGHVRHRLWLTNHIDPRDAFKRPYLAKHRGTPLGMPDFLEDPWSDDPAERAKLAWTVCSLKYFFQLLEAQFAEVQAADAARFAGFAAAGATAVDEVMTTQAVATPVRATLGTSAVTGGSTLRSALRQAGTPMSLPPTVPTRITPPLPVATALPVEQQAPPVPTPVEAGLPQPLPPPPATAAALDQAPVAPPAAAAAAVPAATGAATTTPPSVTRPVRLRVARPPTS